MDAGKLDDDLVGALLADLRLGDAELVNPVPHDLDRPADVVGGQRVALRRYRLQHDLESALEVEPERRLAVGRRARDHEQGHPGERQKDDPQQDEMVAPVRHELGKVSRALLFRRLCFVELVIR